MFKIQRILNTSKTFFKIRTTKIFQMPKLIYKAFTKSNNKEEFSREEPFPKYDKKDFYDENDLIINIGEKETFKGMLVICPTPIGNINDISIRQYEALKNGDILACEDTRKTGKLLELVQMKKMKEKFYSEFGLSFEEFVNRGGLDMNDEQIKKEFYEKNNSKDENMSNQGQDEKINEDKMSGNQTTKENYNDFYESEKDIKDFKKFEERMIILEKINENSNPSEEKTQIHNMTFKNHKLNNDNTISYGKKSIYANIKTQETSPEEIVKDKDFFSKLKKRVDNKIQAMQKNKKQEYFNDLENIVQEVNLNFAEEDPKNFINELKKEMDEPVTQEYYKSVSNSEDFNLKKTIIENSTDDLKEFIEPLAETYDEKKRLSYKLRTKAKFLMGMLKKYEKKDEESENESKSKEEIFEEEMSLNSGLEDHMFATFKRKIKEEKDKKGRGLMIPFNGENEEAKIPKLIRAMKMGLRVVLVSDAGTPGISDPGYKLVKETSKNGIIVEPLPGPSAVITALSASAMPTDKFVFMGYLPKTASDKIAKLQEIKRIKYTTVLFESPHRIKRSLDTMIEILGPNQEIYLGFELTKKFETHMHGTLESIQAQLNLKEDIKGEITLILSPFKDSEDSLNSNSSNLVKLEPADLARKIESVVKLSDKDLRKLLVEVCDISTHQATKIIENTKNRESSLLKFYKKTGLKPESVTPRPIEDYLKKENEGDGKTRNITKIIKRKREKTEKTEDNNKL